MATIFGSNGNNTLIVESDNLRGLGGDDTYIVTNAQSNTAGSPPGVVTIVDTEGNNRLQLADGLQISRVEVLGGNAVQLTLSNNQRIQLLGADRFTFDVGGNTVAGDAEGLTGRTFAQFVNDFGIALTNGAGSTAGPVMVQPGSMPLGVPPPPPPAPPPPVPPNPAPLSELLVQSAEFQAVEGNTGTSLYTVTFERRGDNTTAATLDYEVFGIGTNPASASDFVGGSLPRGTLSFAPGQTTRTLGIAVQGDTVPENNEQFVILFGNTVNATTRQFSLVADILNDDLPMPPQPSGLPVASVRPLNTPTAEFNSGLNWYSFGVFLSGDTSRASSVNYTVAGLSDNPANGADFFGGSFPSGTVNFAPGQTSQTITISVAGDTAVEADERFTLFLSGASGATIGADNFTIRTIVNDDTVASPPSTLPVVSILGFTNPQIEGASGNSPYDITLRREGNTSGSTTVQFSVSGTGANPTDAQDFVGGAFPSGMVTFAPGETTQVVRVSVQGDNQFEADESFAFTLSSPTGATLGQPFSVTAFVNNDDGTDDFSDTTGTTGRVTVGGTANGVLEALADRDWFAVDLVAGQTYRVNLSAAAGSSLDTFLRVLNSAGVQLAFDDDSGTGFNSELVFSASETGRYFIEAGAFNGNTTGAYTVSVAVTAPPPPPPPNDTSRFNIALDYTGPAQYRSFFEQAAARLEQVIVGDLASSTYNGVFVDDVLISSSVQNIDGPGNVLGQAGPDRFRTGNQPLPVHGVMEFDSADADALIAEGGFGLVVLHEMLHVLGFGTLWNDYGFNTTFGQYTGAQALQEYRAARDPGAAFVPLETGGGGGSANSHWADGLFFGEVMGAFYTRGETGALSRITAGALEDLGYTVNYNAADPFSFNPRLVAQTPDGDPGVQGILIAQPPKPMVWMPETT